MSEQFANEVNYITVSSLARYIAYSINAKRPACFWSRPGVGKSAIMAKVAKMLGFHMEDIRLSQIESIDLRGAPTKSYLTIELDENNNIVDEELRSAKSKEHNNGIPIIEWAMPDFLVRAREKALQGIPTIFFFDELNHGDETTQAPAYQFILDNKIGCFSLGEQDRVFAACNFENEGSIANPMSLALANRMAHFYIEADHKSFLRYARDENLHPMLISAVEENPELVYLFPEDEGMSKNKSFSTPRTLEYASDYLYQILDNQKSVRDLLTKNISMQEEEEETIQFRNLMIDDILPSDDEVEFDIQVTLSGCLGMVAAQDIMNFIRIGKDLPSAENILNGNHEIFKEKGVDFKRTDIQALLSNQALNRINNEYKELLKLHREHKKERVAYAPTGIPELEKAKSAFFERYENFAWFAKNNYNPDLFVLSVVTRLIREMKIQPFKTYMKRKDTVSMISEGIDRISQDNF